jgi:hypothetical protein
MSNVHPLITRALRPWSPPSSGQARIRSHILEEYEHFAGKVRAFELDIRFRLSSVLIDTGCESERPTADNYIHDMLQDLFGRKWKQLRARYDEEGGDVARMPFPSTPGDAA